MLPIYQIDWNDDVASHRMKKLQCVMEEHVGYWYLFLSPPSIFYKFSSLDLTDDKIVQIESIITLSQTTNLRIFQIERLCRLEENGGKFSKRIENTAGKGEIACFKQFLLFPQCFKRFLLQTRKTKGLFGKGLRQQMLLKTSNLFFIG